MSLPQEIIQLILTIHHFEQQIVHIVTQMAPLKQQLFNITVVTKRLIWNYMAGQNCQNLNKSQLKTFMRKHNSVYSLPYLLEGVDLIFSTFSSQKDERLCLQDLWSIFKPLTIKFTEEIMIVRQRKISIAKNTQIHYKITDILCSIIQKTIDFLITTQQMKQNIAKCQATPMIIQPLDAAHLHIFIHSYAPDLILKDVEMIFRHIMKNKVVCAKSFQEYFIPRNHHGDSLNPNGNHESQELQELQGLQLIKYHKENVYFMKQERNKKALYLKHGKNVNKI